MIVSIDSLKPRTRSISSFAEVLQTELNSTSNMKLTLFAAGSILLCLLICTSANTRKVHRTKTPTRVKRQDPNPDIQATNKPDSSDGNPQSILLIAERSRFRNLAARAIKESTGGVIGRWTPKKGTENRNQEQQQAATVFQVVPFYSKFNARDGKFEKKNSKAQILLLRNPFKDILGKNGVEILRENKGKTEGTSNKLIRRTKRWINTVKKWIPSNSDKSQTTNLLLIEEVEFFKNPKGTLEQVHKFLDIPLNEERLDRVLADMNIAAEAKRAKRSKVYFYNLWKESTPVTGPAFRMLKKEVAVINLSLVKKNGQTINILLKHY